jgi:flagellar FliJ protein
MRMKELSIDAQVFAAEQERRRLSRIEMMIGELLRSVAALEDEIAAEERRVRISDPRHIAYSTYARAASRRRDNLVRTIGELRQRSIAQSSAAA